MKQAELVRRSIKSDLVLTGTPAETVYRSMGLSRSAWQHRMKDPDLFRAGEIRILRRYVSKETADMITV